MLVAVQENDLPVVVDLVKRGADVNRRGPLPYPLLMIAAGRGYVQMTDLLLSAGADVYALDSTLGASSLHKAAQSGVVIINNSRVSSRTNESFVEQTQQISVQSGEKQLVNFLYNLGSGNSMIRVKDLSLRPEANRMSLGGNITLVASYQRNLAARPKTAAAVTTKPVPTPAKPTEKRLAPPEKRTAPTNRVTAPTDRRPKPTDRPGTSTNKRS